MKAIADLLRLLGQQYRPLTEGELAEARGNDPQNGWDVDDLDWHYDPAFPIARFRNNDQWGEWLAVEWTMEEKYSSLDWIEHKWLQNPEIEPVVIIDSGGQLDPNQGENLWDGAHRVAVAWTNGVETVPAYVGVPTYGLRHPE